MPALPAKLNFATIVRRVDLAVSLRGVWPIAVNCLGPLVAQSIQNFEAGTIRDTLVEEVFVEAPAFADSEIVVFYPNNASRGSLVVSHEGSFDVITLSTCCEGDLDALAEHLWRSSLYVVCVLAGEELEVDERGIRDFLKSGKAADLPPLCDVALLGAVDNRSRQLVVIRKSAV